MNAVERATEVLIGYLRDEEQRVLAFKGPWGVGKSFFVRTFIAGNRERLPPFVAFASVFGLRSLSEVRDVVSGCIEPTTGKTLVVAGRNFSKALSWVRPSLFGVSLNIPDLSNAAFWHLAKRYGLLVILDDLERAHEDLSLDELLGFASSLTENSKAKVILIFNESNLGEERSQILSRYREKVIDAEVEYRPATADLVTKFLDLPAIDDAVIRCLDASGGANIRLILRIKRGIRDLQSALKGFDLQAGDDDLKQVARIIWLFHVSPTSVTAETLKNCYTQNFFGRADPQNSPQNENEVVELAKAGGVVLTDLDPLLLDYMRCGYFSEATLEGFAQDVRTGQKKAEYRERSREAYAPHTNNFRAPPDAVAIPVERLLDDYCATMDLETLKSHCDFIASLGRPATKWWVQHLDAVASTLNEYDAERYLAIVTDPAAVKILENQRASRSQAFDAKAAMRRIAEQENWNEGDMAALDSLPAQYYRDWFLSETGEGFLVMLRSFLRVCSAAPAETNRSSLVEKLVLILQEIARENPANEMRVHGMLRIPRPVIKAEERTDAV